MEKFNKYLKIALDNYLYIIFVFSLFGVLGSLYASEVKDLAPCILCWYQRILLYPLLLISIAGIFSKDKNTAYYVLPFTILGAPMALYHYLLQKTDIFESLEASCGTGIACSTIYVDILGFITIPLMSFVAFSVIGVFSFLKIKSLRK